MTALLQEHQFLMMTLSSAVAYRNSSYPATLSHCFSANMFAAVPAGAAQAAAARAEGNGGGRAGLQMKWIKREWFPQTEAGGNHQKQIKIKTTFQQETMEQM